MDFLKRLFQRKPAVPAANGDDPVMVSWVVLSGTRVELTVDLLRAHLDEVFPGHFLPPGERSFVLDGPVCGAMFFIQCAVPGAAGTFLLHTVAGPYTEVSGFTARIEDAALRRLCEAQTAWLSVELVSRHTTADDAYRFIGRLLARLAPADAVALVHPSRLVTLRFDDDLRRRLASGERF